MKNTNLTKKDILERIGYFRNQKGISAYKLGMELGHSKNYFYRIESGEIQLTLDMFLDVLQILKVSTSEFFCEPLSETEQDFIKAFSTLSQENKETILNLTKNLK